MSIVSMTMTEIVEALGLPSNTIVKIIKPIEAERVCAKCGQRKPLEVFVRDRRKRGGYGHTCKQCERLRHKQYNKQNKKKRQDWHQANPQRTLALSRAWRAQQLGSEGFISSEEWNNLLEKYGHHCLSCDDPDVTMDHIIPLQLGGRHHIQNIQPLCRSCNTSKGTRYIDYRPDAYWADWI